MVPFLRVLLLVTLVSSPGAMVQAAQFIRRPMSGRDQMPQFSKHAIQQAVQRPTRPTQTPAHRPVPGPASVPSERRYGPAAVPGPSATPESYATPAPLPTPAPSPEPALSADDAPDRIPSAVGQVHPPKDQSGVPIYQIGPNSWSTTPPRHSRGKPEPAVVPPARSKRLARRAARRHTQAAFQHPQPWQPGGKKKEDHTVLDPEKETWPEEKLREKLDAAKGRQTVLVIAGSEGTGHHMYWSILAKASLLDQETSGRLTHLFLRVWAGGKWTEGGRRRPAEPGWDREGQEKLMETASKVLKYAKVEAGNKDSWVMMGNIMKRSKWFETTFSFPFEGPIVGAKNGLMTRGNCMYPDLLDVVTLCRYAGCDVKILVTVRHPSASTLSILNKWKRERSHGTLSAFEQVQTVEESLLRLESQLQSVKLALQDAEASMANRVHIKVQPLEELFLESKKAATSIDSFLGSGNRITQAIPKIGGSYFKNPKAHLKFSETPHLTDQSKAYLNQRFSPERMLALWPTVFQAYERGSSLEQQIAEANKAFLGKKPHPAAFNRPKAPYEA